MNITYVVGNGLDIQYGLKTRYKDFYNYQIERYIQIKKSGQTNCIYEALLEDERNQFENWSDFELSLGILTKDKPEIVSDGKSCEKFIDNFMEVIDDLNEYLRNEQNNFKLDGKQIDFRRTLDNLKADLPQANQHLIDSSIQKAGISHDSINILTFNYTNIIDELYKQSKKEWEGSFTSNNYSTFIKGSIHAHGTLDFNLVLGLSNEEQFSEQFYDTYKRFLLKQSLLSDSREELDNRNKTIINSSDIIIIYGMSIGETDTYFWNMIANHSVENNIPVIVYNYEVEFDRSNPIRMQRRYDEFEQKIITNSGIAPDLEEKLKSNLITVIGKSIFELVDSEGE